MEVVEKFDDVCFKVVLFDLLCIVMGEVGVKVGEWLWICGIVLLVF